MKSVILEVLLQEEEEYNDAFQMIQTMEDVFKSIFTIDVFDLSPIGVAAFHHAVSTSNKQMDHIEERLAKLLRDKLFAVSLSSKSDAAEDMFRIFSRFHPLLSLCSSR